MNEIKTLTMEPAKIEFNHEEILQSLDENLKKYDGLTFTEEQTAELRKTLAELRKGVKAVEDYRKTTKKKLNEPVTAFEKQCKEIVFKFDERISAMDKQLKDFEAERKAKKTVKIEEIIANTINLSNLDKKYADRVLVEDEYLNKSMSIKEITETIKFQVDNLLTEQAKAAADREVIETYVNLKNNEHDMNLPIEPYLSQLDFNDYSEVKRRIETDIDREIDRRKQKEESESKRSTIQEEVKKEIDEFIIGDLPFGDIEEEGNVTLGIIATESQLNSVKLFLDGQGIYWEVFNDDRA